ncbi:polysaccharide biosynthesis tyrosine autokinase [Mycobacterium sp. SM3041]|uniref:polysaccharide biosynthesis tyrosine autokinase n=1 Tax=Mycobacterium sp. SM3041 TaxID=3114291 RepID=UPI003204DFA1
MKLQDFLKLIRARWITVCLTVVIVVLGALIITVTTTPLYRASTRLFVSTAAGNSLTDIYQGNRLSQERVLSYTQLLMGRTLAERTIKKLEMNVSPEALQAAVTATAKPDTVLIDVGVLDESPGQAAAIANALSDEFVNVVRELETPAGGTVPDARIVVEQHASVPTAPVIPKTARNLVLGLVVGLLGGVGLALLREQLDNTVKDRNALEGITHVGIVGDIPLDKERRKTAAISFKDSSSGIAEAFRKLRTNLSFLAVDNPPRVIVVTSSVPEEGKSTTAINIALALAEADRSVVLVDGDMRRPMVHKYLGLVGTVGLSTVLSGAMPVTEALQETKFAGLSVLAAGAKPPNPSELLGSHVSQKVLAELASHFDYVIVDSSPLLAVTDAAILAANADGAIIMARYGQTKRQQLADAVAALADVDANLLGAVFTMIPTNMGSYSYSYSYYGRESN